MVVLLVLGFAAYFQLGQDEDPPFTFRAMVVRAFWPGATAQQVAEQVTDKLEKTLQEVPYADKIRSYSKPGESLIIFQMQRLVAAEGDAADLVHGAQEDRRHARHAAAGRRRARSSTTSSATSTARSTRSRPTASATRSCKDHADHVRQRLLRVQDVAKVEHVRRAGREDLRRDLAEAPGAARASTSNQVLAQLGAQNAVESAGAIDAADRHRAGARRRPVRLGRASCGASRSAPAGASVPARRHRRRSGAATSTRRRSRCATRARRSIALGVSMAKGGDIIELGKALQTASRRRSAPSCRSASSCTSSRTSRRSCRGSVNEFVRVLIEAVLIVLAVSFVALGLHPSRCALDWRPGLVVAITIPLVLAITFLVDVLLGHRPAQDLARLADHRARPAGRRRDHRGRDDGAQARGGLRQGARRDLRLRGRRRCRC